MEPLRLLLVLVKHFCPYVLRVFSRRVAGSGPANYVYNHQGLFSA